MARIIKVAFSSFAVAAALQTSSNKQLPDVDSMMGKPSAVMSALSEKISVLKQQLADADLENKKVIKWAKADLEAKLYAVTKNATVHSGFVTRLSHQIRELDHKNMELQKKATESKEYGLLLQQKLNSMKAPLASAEELLKASKANLSTEDPLAVLDELDAKDAIVTQAQAHLMELSAVGPTMALLQGGSERAGVLRLPDGQPSTPKGAIAFVKKMQEKFDILDAERNETLAKLQVQFDEDMKLEMENLNKVVQQEAELRIVKEGKKALHDRLEVALDHLLETNKYLQQNIDGLKAYVGKFKKEEIEIAQDERKMKTEDRKEAEEAHAEAQEARAEAEEAKEEAEEAKAKAITVTEKQQSKNEDMQVMKA